MRTNDRLTFELLAQNNGSETVEAYVVHPGYDGLKLSYSRPDGKMYYATEVGGKVIFLGQEAQLIQSKSIYCKFTLIIYDEGEELIRGTFRKTDCKTDCDHWRVETEIKANDIYDELESDNSEYNIIKFGMQTYTMKLRDKAVIQAYLPGGTSVYEFSGLSYYKGTTISEQTVSDLDSLEDDYGFHNSIRGVVVVGGNEAYSGTYVFGQFDIFVLNSPNTPKATNGNGWYMKIEQNNSGIGDGDTYQIWLDDAEENPTTSYRIWVGDQVYLSRSAWISQHNVTFYTYPVVSEAFQAQCRFWDVASRTACNKSLSPVTTDKNAEDFYDTKHKYVAPAGVHAVISTQLSGTDNGFAQYDDTHWYAPPSSPATNYIPIYQSEWFSGVSVWIMSGYTPSSTFSNVAEIRDWYLLGDVVKGMLAKIDDSLVFELDEAHSQFLFAATNPVSGDAQYPIYVTQKSNLLNYTYEYPAWSALLTWNRLETMLRNLFNCYYDIYTDENGVKHFRIEHWIFYANGLSYTTDPRTNIDLRHIYDGRTKKSMAFLTNRWEYDSDRPFSRLEFAWMDNQSEPFDAYPIQVPKALMIYSRNTIDDRTTDWFSADIDFMLTVASEVSSDGFVIAMSDGGEDSEDGAFVHQGVVHIADIDYYCQNDRMALGYLQKAFLLSGIYASHVTMDNTEDWVAVPNIGRKKMRLQELEFTLPKGMLATPEYNYVTEVGAGTVESMEIDLTDMRVKATLRQKTEDFSDEEEDTRPTIHLSVSPEDGGTITVNGNPLENGIYRGEIGETIEILLTLNEGHQLQNWNEGQWFDPDWSYEIEGDATLIAYTS